jgi:rhodanese-related sulfurtransferase
VDKPQLIRGRRFRPAWDLTRRTRMDDIPRIDVCDPHRRVQSGYALLVCAYDNEGEYRRLRLEGGTALVTLQRRAPSLSREREIIFYCACPAETTSAREARRFRSYGFTDTKALRGGVGAWKKAGYLMVGAYCLTR